MTTEIIDSTYADNPTRVVLVKEANKMDGKQVMIGGIIVFCLPIVLVMVGISFSWLAKLCNTVGLLLILGGAGMKIWESSKSK